MNSEVSVKDNVMDIIDIDQNEYNMIEEHLRQDHYSVNQQDDQTVAEPGSQVNRRSYIEIQLRASNIKRVYKREVVDILTYLGDLGGLIDILLVIG